VVVLAAVRAGGVEQQEVGAVAGLLDAGGVPWPWPFLAVAGTLLVAALALLGLALVRLDPRPRPYSPGPPPEGLGGALDGAREEVDATLAPRDRAPTP
jgi:hypothetical protein